MELTKKLNILSYSNFDHRPATPKNRELELRKQIKNYINSYAKKAGVDYRDINLEVNAFVGGKARAKCTLKELEYLNNKIRKVFVVNHEVSEPYNDMDFGF